MSMCYCENTAQLPRIHRTIASAAINPPATTPIEPPTLSPAALLALAVAAAATVVALVIELAATPPVAPPLADCETLAPTRVLEVEDIFEFIVILVFIIVPLLVAIVEVLLELLLFPMEEEFAALMVGEAARLTLETLMVEYVVHMDVGPAGCGDGVEGAPWVKVELE